MALSVDLSALGGSAAARSHLPHPQLRSEWVRPKIPDGYDELVCCLYDWDWELDFLNSFSMDYASMSEPLALSSPWAEGFIPSKDDWRAIGILVVDMRTGVGPF